MNRKLFKVTSSSTYQAKDKYGTDASPDRFSIPSPLSVNSRVLGGDFFMIDFLWSLAKGKDRLKYM